MTLGSYKGRTATFAHGLAIGCERKGVKEEFVVLMLGSRRKEILFIKMGAWGRGIGEKMESSC